MQRKIIQIDQEKCIGCGLCTNACQQGVITIVDGKATIMHSNYCDGIGNCLPVCPVDAISFSNQDIVTKPKANQNHQWPLQLKLVLPEATFFDNADLLIAADCTAFAYANFNADFMKNKVTVIGCPKLDEIDYTSKLTDIIKNNNIKCLTTIRMQVPCCFGIENAAQKALLASGKDIAHKVIIISTDGQIVK